MSSHFDGLCCASPGKTIAALVTGYAALLIGIFVLARLLGFQ